MAAVQHPAGGPVDAQRSSEARLLERAAWAHAFPFILWIFLMKMLGDPSGWNYAVRTAVCLAVFLVLRPWRGYAPPRLVYAFPALAVGVAVFVVWVLPESDWAARHAPVAHEFYRRWLVGLWPPGRLPEPPTSLPYAPEIAGWSFALIRLPVLRSSSPPSRSFSGAGSFTAGFRAAIGFGMIPAGSTSERLY